MASLKKTLGVVFKRPTPRDVSLQPRAVAPSGRAPDIDWIAVVESFAWKTFNDPSAQDHRKQGVFHPSAGLVPQSGACMRNIVLDLLHAPRSRQRVSAGLHRVFTKGHRVHGELNELFLQMAQSGHMGIRGVEHDVPVCHPWLPIEGELDMRVEMRDRHRYVFDFKSCSEKNADKTFKPKFEHIVQLNTYLGCIGEPTGYVIYQNKSNQKILGPMKNFRVDYNHDLFTQTEEYCIDILNSFVNVNVMPEYVERTCKANINFCSYVDVCSAERKGELAWTDFDQRPATVAARHLKVLQ